MTKRATRSATTRRATPKKRAPQRRAPRPGPLDHALAALPVSEATIRRVTSWAIVILFGTAALAVASWTGALSAAGVATAEIVGDAGFRLSKIDITGLKRMDRNTVYAQALDQKSRAMPLIDLEGVRQRLLQYPWIADARVSRRLPDTLVIHIVEREPAAIWQHAGGQLTLIDVDGASIEPVSREAMPALPLLVGDNANTQELARRTLLEAAPMLRPMVKAATWIGNRRWNLTFDTGETLMLPEGDDDAAKALIKFAELDTSQRLLGRGYQGFDLRDPDRLVIRKAAAAPAVVPVAAPSAGPSPIPSPTASPAAKQQSKPSSVEREG
ncbi:FtsQ-type POTRA domain-containing protein [Sphingomonas sp.]|uniref:cell division protein FtsQ/DivIB n=1 Tax=Sphingomonas sp. TaxID=28214 RepID=UPI001B0ED859|nr:FtsQ-type POTRA domain-containing protein [Sphingomonas sp.]MBO9714331.1 FtsQ-type POTRA domain-containing protein [Sphingomonas sp.]